MENTLLQSKISFNGINIKITENGTENVYPGSKSDFDQL